MMDRPLGLLPMLQTTYKIKSRWSIRTLDMSDYQLPTMSSKKKSSESILESAEQGEVHPVDPISSTIATKDPLDPLNWTFVEKWTCISISCLSYFQQLYFTTVIIPSFPLLQSQFDSSYNEVNWTFAIQALGMAAGPLLTASLADTYGRRNVLIASTMVALIASGCTSIKSSSLSGFMAARFFIGLGAGPSANLGLSVIHDVSFEHERGFRVGLWAMAANLGCVTGALGMSSIHHR